MKRKFKLPQASHTGLANRFMAQVIEQRPDHPDFGKVVFETPFNHNLILENGMNAIASNPICNLFTWCAIGSGTTPTEDDSGAITVTISGTAATAGTAFFGSGDVGKLLRCDTGEKAVISAFIDSTHVTLATSLTVASPTLFTMYRIAQNALATEVVRSANYLTGTGNCGTTVTGGVLTHQRTFDFPIEVSDQTYNEVGFSSTNTPGANLNTRGIFAGAPVSVLTGQQLRVIYFFVVTATPVTQRTRAITISGWPSLQHPVVADATTNLFTLVAHGFAANTQVQFIGTTAPAPLSFGTVYYVVTNTADTFSVAATSGGSTIDLTTAGTAVVLLTNTNGTEQLTSLAFSTISSTTGNTTATSSALNEPRGFGSKGMALVDDATPVIFGTVINITGATGCVQALTQDSYSTGSYTTTWRATYGTTVGNSSLIRQMFMSDGTSGNNANRDGLAYIFDQKQEKTNLFTLTAVWSFTWDRDFV